MHRKYVKGFPNLPFLIYFPIYLRIYMRSMQSVDVSVLELLFKHANQCVICRYFAECVSCCPLFQCTHLTVFMVLTVAVFFFINLHLHSLICQALLSEATYEQKSIKHFVNMLNSAGRLPGYVTSIKAEVSQGENEQHETFFYT